jgi:hypothetical protein
MGRKTGKRKKNGKGEEKLKKGKEKQFDINKDHVNYAKLDSDDK